MKKYANNIISSTENIFEKIVIFFFFYRPAKRIYLFQSIALFNRNTWFWYILTVNSVHIKIFL